MLSDVLSKKRLEQQEALFTEKFKLYNMKSRPVFIRPTNDFDGSHSCLPRWRLICEECGQQAKYRVFELDETAWFWCGECDQGG